MTSIPPVVVAIGSGLALAGLPYVAWSRLHLRRTPGVFTCRLRPAGPLEGSGWRRRRRKRRAHWAQGVLLVHRGITTRRHEALPVASVTGPVVIGPAPRWGERLVLVRLHLDDGRLLDLVARDADRAAVLGPFITASLR